MPQPIIALTRPRQGSEAMAQALADLPATILVAPLQEIRPRTDEIVLLDQDILVFTSRAAICSALQQITLAGRAAFAVGAQSAKELRKAGATVIGQAPTATELAGVITQHSPKERCHYLRGRHISLDLPKLLNSAGIETVSTIVYDQLDCPASAALLAALHGDSPVILPLFSARSAALLDRTTTDARATASLYSIAISEAVNAQINGAAMTSRLVAASPDADAMMKEIRALVASFD